MINWKSKIIKAVDKNPPSKDNLSKEPGSKSDFDLIEKPSDRFDPLNLKPASVVVGITEDDIPKLFLTKRSEQLEQHSGQIAFPGGKVEIGESFTEAAIREAEEEVGLEKKDFEICGYLDTYETGTGYRILPVVVFIKSNFTPRIDINEVAETFEVPFDFLMDSSNHQLQSAEWKGMIRKFYTIPYEKYKIWGATAGMIRNLYERINEN
ncbi:CoA pyrophosphatase [bacterium]|nr:CoA pyrophosphatase [bacterium]